MRPDLRIEPAFLDLSKPNFQTVVDRLVRAGFDEIVVVPLLLSEAFHAKVDVPTAVAEATARHARLQIRATEILGMEPVFLEVLDRRMREALCAARVPRARRPRARRGRFVRPAGQPGGDPARPAVGLPPQAAHRGGVRLRVLPRPPVRPSASSVPRAAGTSPSARCSWPPATSPTGPPSSPRGRCRGGLRAAGCRPRGRSDDPGPLRRGRRGARARLTHWSTSPRAV